MKSTNYITLELQTQQTKHLNKLLAKGISIFKVRRRGKTTLIVINWSNLNEVKTYLDEVGVVFSIVSHQGSITLFSLAKRRWGMIVGVFLGLIILVLSFNLIFTVKVSDTEKVDVAQIQCMLEDYSLNKPRLKLGLNTDELKEKLSTLDGVALISVYVKGVVLHIEINEELDEEKVEQADYRPIIADCDGIVESVIVESGTALVERGQVFKKGDVLIAPYYKFKDDSVTPCEAVGEVWAKLYKQETLEYAERRIVEEKTDRKESERVLIFCGKPLSTKKDSSFEKYIESTKIINVPNFPFEILEITRQEVVVKEIFVNFLEIKKDLEQEILLKTEQSIKKNVQIIRKWCIIRDNMGIYVLTGIVEYIDLVGVKNESG